ncbi:Adenylosuccinate synthetase [Schizosaccharomyces pombe]|uniref:Adenylosuccinate synthetase n=1 Tax=Schizosaccharomyces pombe (strain 972 / ATCC 24843) TaxID=284812 RepID=PURA_SCHPO|nr:adenylosuccinate synthetase Ade2 [Schizosaccharomyces pombe]Q02787.2 RecName: Full=Adenylosuccinate synthetase; Short=AMPSase; Short=AdSS; AltName: Full=IMP--aspartate ligase [Schizosaccharomyces pombe 972h-]BAA19144.1 adenylsuccinate synthetase [Schizosaccharomyces pombe]CAB59683.1 adenylosuccinate synthetase Ade2 [Schizosaccharomyces pombe]|eukprot:NP_594664.1 adenylosuccinate synthetase Ade2 [Schizosaccharomyces pombe]
MASVRETGVNVSNDGITVVLGSQWGDEGKGKLVDILCDNVDVCARCQGGNNAGHTIVANGVTYDFHILPSGLVNPKCQNLIGSGVVVYLPAFFSELEKLEQKGLKCRDRIFISDRAHLVFDYHQRADALNEAELGKQSIGTTGKGIGPAYSTKATRSGIRVHHLYHWAEFEARYRKNVADLQKRYGAFEYDVEAELIRYKELAQRLKPFVIDAVAFMYEALQSKKRILVEGANALMLDLDFGTYPFVTSSNTTVGGVCTGLGVPPQRIANSIGVVKAYTTRVGAGPFPTEQLNEIGDHLQSVGREVGVTTGRKRRCGWLDLVVVKYSTMINGYTSLNLTKLDILDALDEIKVAVAYIINGKRIETFPADLDSLEEAEIVYETFPGWKVPTTGITHWDQMPENAKKYIEFIEKFVGVPITFIGVGPGRDEMLVKE